MSFLIDPDVHYLNCAYMSPLSHASEAAGHVGMARKQRPWTIRPEDFFIEVEDVKARFAAVLGTPRHEQVAVLPSVSYGMAIVARNLPLRAGQHIVVAGEQFPSNVHPWRRLAAQRDAEVRTVAAPEVPCGPRCRLERGPVRRHRRPDGATRARSRALGGRHALRPGASGGARS